MASIRETATSTSDFAEPLPAGRYLVGDPCYSFTNGLNPHGADLWMEWLDAAWAGVDPNRVTILDAEVRGFRIAASSTAYGDGFYEDQDGHGYGVDAGLIGAVPLEAIRVLYPEYAHLDGEAVAEKTQTRLVEFDQPFHVSFFEEDGGIDVGGVYVVTGDTDEGCGNCGEQDCDEQCLWNSGEDED